MKLLIATQALGFYGESDGVVTFYNDLIKVFANLPVNIDLITYGPKDEIIKKGNITIYVHKPKVPLKLDDSHKITVTLKGTKLSRSISKKKYDFVFSGTPDAIGFFVANIAKKQNIPFVIFYHTELAEYAKIRFEKKLNNMFDFRLGKNQIEKAIKKMSMIYKKTFMQYLKRYYKKADVILVPSKSVIKNVKEYFNGEIRVLPHGIDLNRFKFNENKIKTHKKPVALYVGRITLEKNIPLLIDVFKEIGDKVDLYVVGDGPYLEFAKESLPDAKFLGTLYGDELVDIYAKADFFVFPSETDTFGLVILEALAMGLPVVVMNKGGPKEIIKGKDVGLIAKNRKEFKDNVLLLAENKKMLELYSKNALKVVKNYDYREIFNELYYVFLKIHKTSKKSKVKNMW